MANRIDYSMIGRRFGRLTVIDVDHEGRNGPYWLCECDCGNTKIVSNNNLKTGNSTSCGCKQRERKTEDLTGRRFGRLIVFGFDHMGKYGNQYWLCQCDCGNRHVVQRQHLLNGHVTSCGCWNVDSHKTHGMTDAPLYHVWVSMRQRCNNPLQTSFKHYGERGITVCDDWDRFENFRDWSIEHGYEPGLTIDRINNDDGYYPDNCRWTDRITQGNNRRTNRYITYNDTTHTIAEWARLFDLNYSTLQSHINRGSMVDFEEYFGEFEKQNGGDD